MSRADQEQDAARRALESLREIAPADPVRREASRRAFLAEAAQIRRRRGVSPALLPPRGRRRGTGIRLFDPPVLAPRRYAAATSLILVAVAALVLVSGGTLFVANAAAPGDALYGVDLAAEDVRLALAPGAAMRASILLSRTQERLEEVQALLNAGAGPERVAVALQVYDAQVQQLTALVNSLQDDALQARTAFMLQNHLALLERLREGAPVELADHFDRVLTTLRSELGIAVDTDLPEDRPGIIKSNANEGMLNANSSALLNANENENENTAAPAPANTNSAVNANANANTNTGGGTNTNSNEDDNTNDDDSNENEDHSGSGGGNSGSGGNDDNHNEGEDDD